MTSLWKHIWTSEQISHHARNPELWKHLNLYFLLVVLLLNALIGSMNYEGIQQSLSLIKPLVDFNDSTLHSF